MKIFVPFSSTRDILAQKVKNQLRNLQILYVLFESLSSQGNLLLHHAKEKTKWGLVLKNINMINAKIYKERRKLTTTKKMK